MVEHPGQRVAHLVLPVSHVGPQEGPGADAQRDAGRVVVQVHHRPGVAEPVRLVGHHLRHDLHRPGHPTGMQRGLHQPAVLAPVLAVAGHQAPSQDPAPERVARALVVV